MIGDWKVDFNGNNRLFSEKSSSSLWWIDLENSYRQVHRSTFLSSISDDATAYRYCVHLCISEKSCVNKPVSVWSRDDTLLLEFFSACLFNFPVEEKKGFLKKMIIISKWNDSISGTIFAFKWQIVCPNGLKKYHKISMKHKRSIRSFTVETLSPLILIVGGKQSTYCKHLLLYKKS